MFPIRNWQGKTVAFGGRDLSNTSKAKYINTPETVIYSKKHNLFGLYEALDTIKKSQKAILCEGNFDVVALHQSGFTNAMAPLVLPLPRIRVSCSEDTVLQYKFSSIMTEQDRVQHRKRWSLPRISVWRIRCLHSKVQRMPQSWCRKRGRSFAK